MKLSEDNWKHLTGALTSWFGVDQKEWLPEAWQKPMRLSTLTAQLELWDLSGRIVKQTPNKVKSKKPILGFSENDSEMVLILPPRRGQKKWLTISGNGDENSFSSKRDVWKLFKNRTWLEQTVLIEPCPVAKAKSNQNSLSGNWFWSAIWKYKGDFLPILPASLLINLFALSMPLFIMNVYDRVVPNEAISTLWVLTTGVCLVFIFEFLLRIVRGSFVDAAGKGADRILSQRVFQQLVQLELGSRPASAGNLAGQARGYESVREFLSSLTLIGLIDFPFALFMFVIVFTIGGPIGLVPVIATGIILTSLLLIQPFLAKYSAESHRDKLNRQTLLSETANGLESIKAVNAGRSLENRMANLVDDSAKNLIKQRRLTQFGGALTALCTHLTTIAVIVWGTILISQSEMSMGGLIACVMIVSRGMAPLGQVSQLLLRLQGVRASLRGLKDVMRLDREETSGKLTPAFDCPEIRCVRAGFQYPDQPVPALSEISLKISPGESVGVIGRAGSGKTTLLRLLNRQLRATEGLILFDGVDATQISPDSIRRCAGYLPQDGTLFAGTAKQNISLGSTLYSDDEIITAARLAGVMGWANRHPSGLDMEVGERGVLLSGGQRQTIMIARIFLAAPRIFLLDEPTNSLDLSAEKKFRASLEDLRSAGGKPRSLVLATHKISLLKLVDRVVVLEGGKILMEGPRDEVLLALNKTNAKLNQE